MGEDAVEEGSDVRHVVLRGCHIDVDRPQVPPFRVRIYDPLKDGFSPFRITELVFKLSEFRNRFQICLYRRDRVSGGAVLIARVENELTFVFFQALKTSWQEGS